MKAFRIDPVVNLFVATLLALVVRNVTTWFDGFMVGGVVVIVFTLIDIAAHLQDIKERKP